jgi:hypothetical protein
MSSLRMIWVMLVGLFIVAILGFVDYTLQRVAHILAAVIGG